MPRMLRVTLTEGAKDRYYEMFRSMLEHPIWETAPAVQRRWRSYAQSYINSSIIRLKRDDRIKWFLRIYKSHMLNEISTLFRDEGNPFIKMREKYISTINKKRSGGSIEDEIDRTRFIFDNAAHFISLDIDQIDRVVWEWQSADDLFEQLRRIEQEWTAEREHSVEPSEDTGAEVVMRFPDGWAWWDLRVSSCSEEGNAMGHCGNGAEDRDTDTVLSLRKRTQRGNAAFDTPYLTFILNTRTGMLGEMKGRANEKPAERYHPYIVALLRSDLIKGITGGGYAAESNFSINDLNDEVRAKLVKEKPDLRSMYEEFQEDGITEHLNSRIKSALNGSGVDTSEIAITSDGKVQVAEFDDFAEFASQHGGDDEMLNLAYILNHPEDTKDHISYIQIDPDDARYILRYVEDDIIRQIASYLGLEGPGLIDKIAANLKNSIYGDMLNDAMTQNILTPKVLNELGELMMDSIGYDIIVPIFEDGINSRLIFVLGIDEYTQIADAIQTQQFDDYDDDLHRYADLVYRDGWVSFDHNFSSQNRDEMLNSKYGWDIYKDNLELKIAYELIKASENTISSKSLPNYDERTVAEEFMKLVRSDYLLARETIEISNIKRLAGI